MSQEQDQAFFRNFSIVVGILAVMMVVFIVLARIYGIDDEAEMERRASSVSERTAPMGEITVATESGDTGMEEAAAETMDAGMQTAATGGESAGVDGKATYDSVCTACHGSGIPGIPQLGDTEAWAPRIAQANPICSPSEVKT